MVAFLVEDVALDGGNVSGRMKRQVVASPHG